MAVTNETFKFSSSPGFPGASAATAAVGAQIANYILANAAKPI